MSTSDSTSQLVVGTVRPPAARVDGSRRLTADLRFLRSELRLVFRRPRNLVLLAVLCLPPTLLGIAVRVASPTAGGDGPPFLGQITDNGLFLVLTALTVTLPVLLPVAVAVAAGESVAGEASTGSLRSLLVVPVGRTRLLVVKYLGILAFALVCVSIVAVTGLLVGAVLFPRGDVTLLSGSTISYGSALGRAGLVALYVTAMLASVGAIGLFISTLTEVPMGAMAATAVVTVASEICTAIPQISAVHPYLFTSTWQNFGDLLRAPVAWGGIADGLLTQAAYVAVFLSLAWARLTTKDVTS